MRTTQLLMPILASAVLLGGCARKRAPPQPQPAEECVPDPRSAAAIAASAESAELLNVFTALLAEAKAPVTPARILTFTSKDWDKYFDQATLEKHLPALLEAFGRLHALCRR